MRAAVQLDTGYGSLRMELEDNALTSRLVNKDASAFEQVFKTHFKNLHAYACTMLKDEDQGEEIVQQVFFKLWERAGNLNFSGSVAAYLYRAVHNESLNYLKHMKVRSGYQLYVAHSANRHAEQPSRQVVAKELENRFRNALDELPEQCRTIFQMSRFEEMKYREIADKLEISVKTVENQMGKALKQLRLKLVEFLPLLFVFFNT